MLCGVHDAELLVHTLFKTRHTLSAKLAISAGCGVVFVFGR